MQRRSRLSAPGLAKAFGFFVKGATESLPGLSTLGVHAYLCALPHGVKHQLGRSEEHTSELQSLMRISYAVFCLKKTTINLNNHNYTRSLTMIYTHLTYHTSPHIT